MANLIHFTDATFQQEVLQSKTPVLVDFTAGWCGPCHLLAPIVEELARDWNGKVKVGKLDIDENIDTTMEYQVMGVPTLMLFINGQPKERLTGYLPKDRIRKRLEPHLG